MTFLTFDEIQPYIVNNPKWVGLFREVQVHEHDWVGGPYTVLYIRFSNNESNWIGHVLTNSDKQPRRNNWPVLSDLVDANIYSMSAYNSMQLREAARKEKEAIQQAYQNSTDYFGGSNI